MSLKNKKLTIQNYISFGAAIVIAALMAKLMHFSWAGPLILIGFGIEILLFIALGFTPPEQGVTAVNSNGGSNLNDELLSELIATLKEVQISTKINTTVANAIINEVGVKKLAESLNKPNEITSLNIGTLQESILKCQNNFDKLNLGLEELTLRYAKQVEAFKAN